MGDLVSFGDALVRGKLVSPVQVAMLTTSHGGPSSGYAYGFHVETFEGQREVGHSGGFDGINAHLSVFPDSGLSIAGMANMDPPAAERICERARELFARPR